MRVSICVGSAKRVAAQAVWAVLVTLAGCQQTQDTAWSGYAEGDYVYVAAPVAGRLAQLDVRGGEQVSAGAPLFALDATPEAQARDQAQAQLEAARAQSANLQTGRRPDEIAEIEAQVSQARVQADLAARDWARKAPLEKQGAVSHQDADAARSALAQSRRRVQELEAALRLARQPARVAERAAAQAQARAASAALAQQQWRVSEAAQTAPEAGLVHDTYFRPGEWVPAGQAVLALLPPARIKARFFVPEVAVAQIKPGSTVHIRCDGCGAPMTAQVSQVSDQVEYTPPVIYSDSQRAKLVFRVDALPAPEQATRLHPGMPLQVTLADQKSE
ncbi:HlyD family secretion protein [Ottowia sp.]|uniref:HlyD family secretion protein n=1 Tax=Ottowia sp. TaxID=1898956 RepID=UPI003A849C1F